MLTLIAKTYVFTFTIFIGSLPLTHCQELALPESQGFLKDITLKYQNLKASDIDTIKSVFKDKFNQQPLKERSLTKIPEIFLGKGTQANEYSPIFENLSENCASQLRYITGTVQGFPKIPETWVLQMLDAWGKLPSGILSGHTSSLGDLQECVQIRGEYTSNEKPGYEEEVTVRGRYCMSYILPGPKLTGPVSQESLEASLQNSDPSILESVSLELLLQYLFELSFPLMFPRLGTCFPAACSTEDIQQFFASYHKYVSKDWLSQTVISCQTNEKPTLDAGDWIMIIILAALVLLCIAGSIIDVWGKDRIKPGIGLSIVLAFSVPTNTKRWLNTKVGSDNFTCLSGIRFLTMAWVLLGHIFTSVANLAWNSVDIRLIYKDWTKYPILNATPSVDTFFVISGFLVTYNLLKILDKTNGKFNYLMFVVHRYLRLTPAVLLLLGILATIFPYFGSGLTWSDTNLIKDACQRYWWRDALYIGNLFNPLTEQCYSLLWYLNVDMQLFLLSPIVIIPLWKWKKIGLGILAVVGVFSVAIPVFIAAHFHQPPTSIPTISTELEFWADLYTNPWCRFNSYTVGIGLGYVMYLRGNKKTNLLRKKLVVVAGWTLCTFFALAVIYGAMYYFDPENQTETLNSAHSAVYAGLHRFVWGLCIAWIIFACVNGCGGWVNKILSLKFFIPLGRLSFGMYLVQYHVIVYHYSSKLNTSHFSVYSTVTEYLGLLLITGFFAYVLLMCVEAPFMQLTKMLLPSTGSQKKSPAKVKDEINGDINGNNTTVKNDYA